MTENIKPLEAITIEPKKAADACIIWLHGLGADGHDFKDVIPSLGLSKEHTIRFIFPHAPTLPVTINGGMRMPAWYDIVALDSKAIQDEKGIRHSEKSVKALIYKTVSEGIKANRIILMGFSQGGALALHTALRFEQPLAGVGVLSAYLPIHHLLMNERNPANLRLSIFMAHGLADTVVPYMMGQASYGWLQNAGYTPQWHSYPMDHSVCYEELQDIGKWIQTQLPAL